MKKQRDLVQPTRIEPSLFAGGITAYDLEYDDKTREMYGYEHQAQSSGGTRGRPGPAPKDDDALIERAKELRPSFNGRKLPAIQQALREFLARPGNKLPGASEPSVIRRLHRKIK